MFYEGYNKASVRVRLWSQGITRSKEQVEKSAKLSEEAALELGAEIIANSMTFAIGIIAIIMQQSIAAATEKKRELESEEENKNLEVNIMELKNKVFDLGLNLEVLDARLRELNRTIMSMDGYNKIKVGPPQSDEPELKPNS